MNQMNRVLKKIKNREYDDEVIEFINKELKWYYTHKDELLNKKNIEWMMR